MILDTTDIQIIRENELGIYDTVKTKATYSCRYPDGTIYLKTPDGEMWLKGPKERILEDKK